MKGKYLITTDAWFLAPDGKYYRAVWGETEIVEDQFLGLKTNRNSSNCFSYDISRKQQKTYCKNKSIERFNHKTGFSKDKDIHGLLWNERVILEVTSIDLDSKRCFVKNPNGFEWLTKLSNIEYCDVNGNRMN